MRDYYNKRNGHAGETPGFELREIAKLIADRFRYLELEGYLQQAFGYWCVDDGPVFGIQGEPLETHFYLTARLKVDPGRFSDFVLVASEAELFTALEFVHDHIAEPDQNSGRYHGFSNCGWHFPLREARFDQAAGRKLWRENVNRYLKHYGEGFELSQDGDVHRLAPDFEHVLSKAAPRTAPETERDIVSRAVRKFRHSTATRHDRKEAIATLYAILERYRNDLVEPHFGGGSNRVLFGIANEFTIRHFKEGQLDDYNDDFLDWLFYVYLATAHLVLELAHGKDPEPVPEPEPGPYDEEWATYEADDDNDVPF